MKLNLPSYVFTKAALQCVSAFIFLFLTGCDVPYLPQSSKPLSEYDAMLKKCDTISSVDEDFDACVYKITEEYNALNAKEIQRRNEEKIKAAEIAKKKQLDADITTCKEYGFQKGAKEFPLCILKLNTLRIEEQHHKERMLAEEKALNNEMQANQELIAAQKDQNHLLLMQATEIKQNTFVPPPITQPMNCKTRMYSGFATTSCH